MDMFRVTVKGRFDGLDEVAKAALREPGGTPMFSEAGSFTFDVNVTAFTFRCQFPAGERDDEQTAKERATAALHAHGYPVRDLRFAVTDMRTIKIRRR